MFYLLVGIDTEGDNQWSVEARLNQTFDNIYALPKLHALFQRHRVRPTYLVTYPVVQDARSADVLRRLREGRDIEIGAHHHAWETPPCTEADVRRHPYALQLPASQFAEQVASLSQAIIDAIGERPLSYRSGRFGFSASHVSDLERAGYRIESSVAPLFYEGHKGGPDFVGAPPTPYFLAYDNPTVPGTSNLLEVPVSAALSRRVPAALERLYGRAPSPYMTKRVLSKLGIARVLWLRPSYSSLDDMCALARRLKHDRVPVLNLIFHSSEAIVGGSPYNRTEQELADFFDRLGKFLAYAVHDLGAIPVTFSEFRALYCGSQKAPDPPTAVVSV
ncbi:MAG: polysaccharide deacetylase family protein [Acidobacteria bacterium]|nr:polysaccharide deacetylase family protein [Acidobacteriota bacterium]